MNEPNTKKRSETDWVKVDSKTDDQLDLTDSPELDSDWFQKAKLVAPATSIEQGKVMNPEFKKVLIEHLNNVSAYRKASKINDRFEAKRRLDESFSKIIAFPDMNEADIKALDEVTRYLESK